VLVSGSIPVIVTVVAAEVLARYELFGTKTASTLVAPRGRALRNVAVPLLVTHTVPSSAPLSQ